MLSAPGIPAKKRDQLLMGTFGLLTASFGAILSEIPTGCLLLNSPLRNMGDVFTRHIGT
jgi:hypothetical protein